MVHESWLPLFDNFEIDLNLIDSPFYPSKDNVFKVYEMDIKDIKIVLLGQDPYHQPNQAHGLSFSVPIGIKTPPSLVNIFKELKIEFPDRNYNFTHGNLDKWFYNEKIFLLNSALTVQPSKAGSHLNIWSDFTDETIRYISENNDNCVFLLLGNYAKSKNVFIKDKDKIINGVHPSPLSAYQGFFNSNIFIQVENKLNQSINWQN